MKAPNEPTIGSAVINIVDNNPTSNNNSISISWTKPDEPGLFTKHKNQSSLQANSTLPKIKKYKLYIQKSDTSAQYELIINNTNTISNDASTSYTLTSSTSYNILPDTQYQIKISAYNHYYNENEGVQSDWFNVSGSTSVPSTISDVSRQLTNSYHPKITSIGGLYSDTTASNYKVLDNFNTPTSASSLSHRLRNLNNIVIDSNSNHNTPILINHEYNKPSDSDVYKNTI